MKIAKALVFLAITSLILYSCEYEWIQPETKPIPQDVSFTTDLMPIFNNGCNNSVCHDAGATPPDLSASNAYNSLIDGAYVDTTTPEASILYTTMKNGSMKPYTDPGDEAIVLAWIVQGAKNN